MTVKKIESNDMMPYILKYLSLLRKQELCDTYLLARTRKTTYFGVNITINFGSKIWKLPSKEIHHTLSLQIFTDKIEY